MNAPATHIVVDGQDPLLEQVADQFEALHASMGGHGMQATLAPNGARLWVDGTRRGLERFGRMVLAVQLGLTLDQFNRHLGRARRRVHYLLEGMTLARRAVDRAQGDSALEKADQALVRAERVLATPG